MRVFGWAVLGFFLIVVLSIFFSITGFVGNWFGRAQQVVSDQVDPGVLLQRYEWFKDASAQLDKKQADIKVFQSRLNHQHCDKAVDRVKIEQCSVWEQETAGVISSYNGLAAEYNAQMSKINWRFTNVGQLPQGATDPLPRAYKPYEDQ